LVNQVTKDGDHSGLQKLQHAVDATFTLHKEDPDDGSRYFYSKKNRFGMVQGTEMRMTGEKENVPGTLVISWQCPKCETFNDDSNGVPAIECISCGMERTGLKPMPKDMTEDEDEVIQ
jgi:Zn ribbon nucleic-acid-binding protein